MFCFFSTNKDKAERQLVPAEHHESLPVPELSSSKPEQCPNRQHKVALCREGVFQARPQHSKNVVFHSLLQSGSSKEAPSWLPSLLHRLGASAGEGLLLWHLRPYMQRLVPVPSAGGKLPHLVHSLTQGPAQPRGTRFAEQAAIQYFVFSSLFNVWPQAKPCSEYRTGGSLTGFLTGSPRSAARQFTSIFIVKHPHLPNQKLRKREISVAASCPLEYLYEGPKGPGFLGHFTNSKCNSHRWPLQLCIISTSTAQTPGSYLGKNHNTRNRLIGGLLWQAKEDLLTVDRAADRGQEWSEFSNVLFAAPFIC